MIILNYIAPTFRLHKEIAKEKSSKSTALPSTYRKLNHLKLFVQIKSIPFN